jgi:hypothetical protein
MPDCIVCLYCLTASPAAPPSCARRRLGCGCQLQRAGRPAAAAGSSLLPYPGPDHEGEGAMGELLGGGAGGDW